MSQSTDPALAPDDLAAVAATPPASAAPSYTQGYKAYVLALIFVMMASNYIDRTIVRVLNPLIKDEFDLTNFSVGLLTGPAFAFLYIFMGVPIAVLSERANRVRIISIAVGIWSVMTVLCGAAQNFTQLLLARIGVGVGESGAAPPSQSLIADYYPPHQRASAVSIHSFGIALGGLLGSVIGGLAAEVWGWRGALTLVGVPGLILAILFGLTVREPPRGHSDPNRAAVDAQARPKFLAVARRLVGNATFIHLALGAGVANFAIQGIHTFDATYLRERFQMGVGEVGVVIGTVGGLATGLGMLVGGFAGDFIAQRDQRWYAWLPAIGLLLTAPIYASAFVQPNLVLTIILLALPNVLLFLFHAPAQAVLHNMSHPRMRATVIALYMVVTATLGLALGPIGVGWLADALASSHFSGEGAFLTACPGGAAPKGASGAMAEACHSASTFGIQFAMVTVCGLFAWSAVHFYFASRTVRRDMDAGLRVEG